MPTRALFFGAFNESGARGQNGDAAGQSGSAAVRIGCAASLARAVPEIQSGLKRLVARRSGQSTSEGRRNEAQRQRRPGDDASDHRAVQQRASGASDAGALEQLRRALRMSVLRHGLAAAGAARHDTGGAAARPPAVGARVAGHLVTGRQLQSGAQPAWSNAHGRRHQERLRRPPVPVSCSLSCSRSLGRWLGGYFRPAATENPTTLLVSARLACLI
jgi:hypothetical protein